MAEYDCESENMSIVNNKFDDTDSAISALSPHNGKSQKKGKSSKSIEETYQKLSQLDHVLLRPDTYIGSTEKQQQQLWVHDGEKMVLKNVTVAPGLYKIFDEILVNAADNKVRDSTMNTLKVEIDRVRACVARIWSRYSAV
jgi:DNA topoisomerase-2